MNYSNLETLGVKPCLEKANFKHVSEGVTSKVFKVIVVLKQKVEVLFKYPKWYLLNQGIGHTEKAENNFLTPISFGTIAQHFSLPHLHVNH